MDVVMMVVVPAMVTMPAVVVMPVVDMMSNRNLLDRPSGRHHGRDNGCACRGRSQSEGCHYQGGQGDN